MAINVSIVKQQTQATNLVGTMIARQLIIEDSQIAKIQPAVQPPANSLEKKYGSGQEACVSRLLAAYSKAINRVPLCPNLIDSEVFGNFWMDRNLYWGHFLEEPLPLFVSSQQEDQGNSVVLLRSFLCQCSYVLWGSFLVAHTILWLECGLVVVAGCVPLGIVLVSWVGWLSPLPP